MDISVRKLEQHSESEWFAELEVGDTVLSSAITVQDEGELRSFQIVESMFQDMLALNGLEGDFSKRLFAFMSSGEPTLPWYFGEQDGETIERVRKHYAGAAMDVAEGER
jgi:hypothetical protein